MSASKDVQERIKQSMYPNSYMNNIYILEDQLTNEQPPNTGLDLLYQQQCLIYTDYKTINPIGYYYPELIVDGKLMIRDKSFYLVIALDVLSKILLTLYTFGLPFYYDRRYFDYVVIMSMIDFWLTKNYIGRKLINIHWWVEYNDELEEIKWVFERRHKIYPKDKLSFYLFWYSKFIWIFLFFGFFSFWMAYLEISQALISLIPILAIVINLHIFNGCFSEQESDIATYLDGVVHQRLRRCIKLNIDPFKFNKLVLHPF